MFDDTTFTAIILLNNSKIFVESASSELSDLIVI